MRKLTSPRLAFFLLLSIYLISCSKSNSNNPNPKNNTPTIDLLSVNTGPYNTSVVINGTGFSTGDKVFFNGKQATVVSATSTQINTTVPLAAGTGNVTITIGNTIAKGPVFTYIPEQIVITVAGGGGPERPTVNGIGSLATFAQPTNITIDKNGNIYVSDTGNNLIRKITPQGVVSTFAGSGAAGFADGLGTAASFNRPWGITSDLLGNVYVADANNFLIRKITPDGMVSTFAGNRTAGTGDGTGKSASFTYPFAIVADASGNLFVTDDLGAIRKVSPQGVVTTYLAAPQPFLVPSAIAIDATGNLYVSDTNSDVIYKITLQRKVVDYAGHGRSVVATNGPGNQATFSEPKGLTVDKSGNVYVGDSYNKLIRKISPEQVVYTFAGNSFENQTDGPIASSGFYYPMGLTIDANDNIYIVDGDEIREITTQ
jgi:sugar lactone lactonase YvrE